MMMSSFGTYQRFQDEEGGVLKDTVKMIIDADTDEEKQQCLQNLSLLHEVLEEYGVFKKASPKELR